MKILSIMLVGCALLLSSVGFSAAAQDAVFDKGSRKADLTVGLGLASFADKNRTTFDQHLSMEWGVARIADKVTFGIGFAVNNMYGASYESQVAGTYNYTYSWITSGKMYKFSTKKWERIHEVKEHRRKGVGTADATISREDIDLLLTFSFHYSPVQGLDTYLKVGAGTGYLQWLVQDKHNLSGFDSADYNEEKTTKYTEIRDIYHYDDLAHAKWETPDGKIVPAISAYIGATYMLSSRWGVDMQLGLINANLKGYKKGWPNTYGIFALGASFHF